MISPPILSIAVSTLSMAAPIRVCSLSVLRMTVTPIKTSSSVKVVHQAAPVLTGKAADIDIAARNGVVDFRNARERHRKSLVPINQPALKREAHHQGRLRASASFEMACTIERAKHGVEHRRFSAWKRENIEDVRD